jgi:hypothetical protein
VITRKNINNGFGMLASAKFFVNLFNSEKSIVADPMSLMCERFTIYYLGINR